MDIIILIYRGGKGFWEVEESAYVKPGFELMPVSPQLSSLFTAPLCHAVLCTTLHYTCCTPYSIYDLVQGIFLLIFQPKTLNFLHDLHASSSPILENKSYVLENI